MRTYFFQYNLPAENHLSGSPDHFIDVVAKWYDNYFSNGDPYLRLMPVNINHKADLIVIKNWVAAFEEMEKISKAHFCGLDNARVIGDLSGPESDLLIQKNLS